MWIPFASFKYLEKRFGKTTRVCASLAYSLQMILYMGIVLYAPALTLEAITNISKENSILIIGKYSTESRNVYTVFIKIHDNMNTFRTFEGLVCTFYSTIGGMKAVLLTDVVQALLMFAAIYSVIVCVLIKAGGIAPIWQVAVEGGRLELWK